MFDVIGGRASALYELNLVFLDSDKERTLSSRDLWRFAERLRNISSKTKTVALEMAATVLNEGPLTRE